MTSVTVITPTLAERATLLAELRVSLGAQPLSVRWLHRVDQDAIGPAQLRNELCAQATTEWLAFVDDDDLLYPTHLTTLLQHSREADVVYSLCDVSGRDWQPEHDCGLQSLGAYNSVPVTSIVRASWFARVGGFPLGERDEDWALWLALRDAGARFACVHEKTWLYRFHDVGRGNRTWWNG